MKPITFFVVAALLVAVPLSAVHAARFERGDVITISQQEFVPDNVYAAGGQVTFSSTAQKDLALFGGKVLDNGVVWGDVAAAGGTVDILEDVRGDVRVAGGQVTIQGIIGGDLIVAGGQVTVLPGTTIAGDLVAAGGSILMEGSVNGQSKIYGGEVLINGTLAGPAFVTVKDSVTFGEKALIGSTLSYRAPEEATIADGAKMGDQVTYTPYELPNVDRADVGKIIFGLLTIVFIVKLIALAFTSALFASLFTEVSRSVANETTTRFWYMLLSGFGVMILTPLLALVLTFTVIGMYLGFLLFAMYGVLVILAAVYQGIVAGALLSKLTVKSVRIDWKWAILGTVLVFVIWLIPILGWVAIGLLYLGTLGSVAQHLYRAIKVRLS